LVNVKLHPQWRWKGSTEAPIAWPWRDQSVVLTSVEDKPTYFFCKRLLDLVGAALLLALFSPLMALIACLIKLDTTGPVFFVQTRIGAKRRVEERKVVWELGPFPFYKFRTMVHNADQTLHEAHIKAYVQGTIQEFEEFGPRFKLQDDPRVTYIGRLLRRTSLDELPQLFNVLKGDMSLVGPRPVPPYEIAEYSSPHFERLAVMQGLTGLWQVEGRGEVPFEQMVQLDIQYIHQQSLWLDLKILLLTLPAVLRGRGAC
jgi:lipopolysaccharide/colanic/teichoic acid biosynthesis glycosyltransferase